ncbi:MAG: arginase family protein [Flavobacteriales bacterium]|nr:arginase family protein [Flavobacteriales bacterium]
MHPPGASSASSSSPRRRRRSISFDIDGPDPTSGPHTGTPVPGGFQFEEATYLLSLSSQATHHNRFRSGGSWCPARTSGCRMYTVAMALKVVLMQ